MQRPKTPAVPTANPPPVRQGASSMMQMQVLIPILLSTFLGVAGQLLLKHGMSSMGALNLSAGPIPILWKMGTSPFVVGGLMVYVSGTFFWLLALNSVPLSYAYPFASLSYVFIFFFSWLLLHEQISVLRVAGMVVIVLGVVLVARS